VLKQNIGQSQPIPMLSVVISGVKPLRIDCETLGKDVVPRTIESLLDVLHRTQNNAAVDIVEHIRRVTMLLFVRSAD
jgi:hypothetical protein